MSTLNMTDATGYRKDIDGLRALAVLPVVLFHLDVALVSGGFIGVDIFFVISGFLITSIIYREVQAGTFSYGQFYERRIRRLFPALISMMLLSLVCAWFMLMPADFETFSEGVAVAVIFMANVHYWNNTDYFSDPVENIALLHTWSLAVEEQFYILFPPLLILLIRYVPLRVNAVLLACAFASLVGAQSMLSSKPEAAFYLVHLRAWELLVGALLATGLVPAIQHQRLRESVSLVGLGLILFSLFSLDKSSDFPGVSALPAVLGAGMIIHAGVGGSSFVSRMLGWRPWVLIGLISYSLYLWHWPIFVFVRYYLIEPFSPVQQACLFFIALGVGWLSWKYIEQPFRRKSMTIEQRNTLFKRTGLICFLLVLVSIPGMATNGMPSRLPDMVTEIAAVTDEDIPFRRPCFGISAEDIDQGRNVCTLGVEGEPEFLLWGDSHALSLAHGTDLAAESLGLSGRFFGKSVCPPTLKTQNFMASDVSCSDFNDAVVRYLDRHPSIKHVVLVGVWFIYDEKSDGKPEESFSAGFERTLALLDERGVKASIIQQVPKIAYDVPSVFARALYFDSTLELRTPLSIYQEEIAPFNAYLSRLSQRHNIRLFSFDQAFCKQEYCLTQLENRPLYRDSHHLSQRGSELVVPELKAILSASDQSEVTLL